MSELPGHYVYARFGALEQAVFMGAAIDVKKQLTEIAKMGITGEPGLLAFAMAVFLCAIEHRELIEQTCGPEVVEDLELMAEDWNTRIKEKLAKR